MDIKSKISTSIQQSERLLELGLKKETADTVYNHSSMYVGSYKLKIIPYLPYDFVEKDIPAWSLARLWAMLPMKVDELYKVLFDTSVAYETQMHTVTLPLTFTKSSDVFDNIIDCIEYLIKAKLFPKEYLR